MERKHLFECCIVGHKDNGEDVLLLSCYNIFAASKEQALEKLKLAFPTWHRENTEILIRPFIAGWISSDTETTSKLWELAGQSDIHRHEGY